MSTLILGSPPGLWLTCGASVSMSTSALSSAWPRSTWVQALRPACSRTPRIRSIYENKTKINPVWKPFMPDTCKRRSIFILTQNSHNLTEWEYQIVLVLLFCGANLNVELVDPDGQVGIGVEIEVIHSLLNSVEDVREGLVIKHTSFQRSNLKINFLLNQ